MGKRVKDDLLTSTRPSPECGESGFIQTWVVADAYIVSGSVLRISNKPRISREYNPFAEYELPTQLARISTGELSPAAFASKFGLLGYDWLQERGGAAAMIGGDPLEWIVAHSRTVALCAELIGLLQGEDPADAEELEEVVETTTAGPYAWGRRIGKLPVRFIKYRLAENPKGHAGFARGWLSNFITENIAGISRRLEREAHGTRLASRFHFKAMIQTVYWQLADAAEGRAVRRCLECKRFFVARDKRQQYCPPFPGAARSRCSSRLNVRKFRMWPRKGAQKHGKR